MIRSRLRWPCWLAVLDEWDGCTTWSTIRGVWLGGSGVVQYRPEIHHEWCNAAAQGVALLLEARNVVQLDLNDPGD